MQLTLQTRLDTGWHDAGVLMIADPANGRAGAIALRYEPRQYVLDHLDACGLPACSLLYPVAIAETYRKPTWFSFLDDIMPAGSARRYWVKTLDLGNFIRTGSGCVVTPERHDCSYRQSAHQRINT